VVPPDAPTAREPGLQGKFSSTHTPGHDVARPGAFHVSVEAGPSDAPATRDWRSSRDGYDRKVAGETVSATAPPTSVPSDAAATRERGYGHGEIQGKFSSAPDQDVSRPGAFHVSVEAGSSNAPTGEGGFNKDEFRRQRPGQTASAATPSSSVPSDAAPPHGENEASVWMNIIASVQEEL
jgi:hypothetical protein